MSTSRPSLMDRHILDLLERFEKRETERIALLEDRIRILEARLQVQEESMTALAASLASFLAPPGLPLS